MREIETKQTIPMATPYQRKIGKVIFQVSAFGNSQANETGQQMILRLLKNKVQNEMQKRKEDVCA